MSTARVRSGARAGRGLRPAVLGAAFALCFAPLARAGVAGHFYALDKRLAWTALGVIAALTLLSSLLVAIVKKLHRAQETLLEAEARARELLRSARDGERMLSLVVNAVPQTIFWKDRDSVYLGCNEAFARLVGLASPAEAVGRTDFELSWVREHAEAYRADDREVMGSGRIKERFLEPLRRGDGALRWVETTKIPLVGSDGEAFGVLGVLDDVTERRSTEDALRESEERLRVIFETSQAGIILVDPTGVIRFANRRMAEMFGCSLPELLGTSYPEHLHPSQRAAGDDRMRRLIRGEIDRVHSERRYARADGSSFWGYLSGRRLLGSDGGLAGLVGIIADVTESKEARDALEAEKERLAVTLRSIGDGVITTDTEGRVALMNRVAEELCGRRQEEAAGLPLADVFRLVDERSRKAAEDPTAAALRGRCPTELAVPGLLLDGSAERLVSASAAPILDVAGELLGAVLVFRDVTEKRAVEEELLRSRKLESLGILAGGIAHDFNNLLTAILGGLSLARELARPDERLETVLAQAERACDRASDLTRQLLTFSRGGAPVKRLTSVRDLVMDSATFALRGSAVRCEFDLDEALWAVEVDPGQMSQVVHNLVLNAVQAMPGGGTLRIRAENVSGPGGPEIRVAVEDTGVGIAPEYLERIFDPYFTTKPEGTGLGLASVHSIVRNHGGSIRVSSVPGEGSSFAIQLPASAEASSRELPPEPDAPRGAGSVLVVDDETAILMLAGGMLEHLGFSPTLCRDGLEACAAYRSALEAGKPYRAVLMDLTIPGGMGGKEAVLRLLEIDPAARVIASSGYSSDPVMARCREFGFSAALAKPYRLSDLARALAAVSGEDG